MRGQCQVIYLAQHPFCLRYVNSAETILLKSNIDFMIRLTLSYLKNFLIYLLQNLPNQGDLSSYLPRADLQNPSIPQVSAFTGSQHPTRGQSASPTFRPPFNPTHVDVGQSYSSPGPSPAPSPALPSPAHSPLPRQQFRSQSLSPVPHNGAQNPTQSQEYHSLPVGYNSGYLPQGQSSQYPAMSQG